MPVPFTLYCKSYRTDLRRVVRLARSVAQFNEEEIPFYVSVPQSDAAMFRQHLAGLPVHVIEDEAILAHTPYAGLDLAKALPGHLSQQVVKSEFWRLGLSDSYLCLDSDAAFIRPIRQSDFVWRDGTPYTVMDEGHEYLESALASGKMQALHDFQGEARRVQSLFKRDGRLYSFGPFPLPWHRAVWESLEREYLRPHGMNLVDAIRLAPLESRWYGEALLCFGAIPLMPCQPLFKVYHYAWQFDQDRRRGITDGQLAQLYAGVIYQSAWEREMDWPAEGGNWLSRTGRRFRRKLGRI
ncbi:MAG: DUF6492 family protein [Hylemonella sp.]|nr:DUF6492 family protein [Hylemonella sp.]MDP1937989.1 DUF6492 family protein [Hylemonella sp.]